MNRSRAVEIFREEDKFRIYFNGAHHHVTVPSLKGKNLARYILRWGHAVIALNISTTTCLKKSILKNGSVSLQQYCQ